MQPKADHKGRSSLPRVVLAKIHIARKALCLDEDDYRDLLERIAGVRSARDLTHEDLLPLQREFRRLGWDGYLLKRDELPPLKYSDMGFRAGRPSPAQLRMLEARFKNIRGYADTNPDAAFRAFLQKRFKISDARLLDDAKYEAALSAVKRLEEENGVKKPYSG
jgi:hypothetical protein